MNSVEEAREDSIFWLGVDALIRLFRWTGDVVGCGHFLFDRLFLCCCEWLAPAEEPVALAKDGLPFRAVGTPSRWALFVARCLRQGSYVNYSGRAEKVARLQSCLSCDSCIDGVTMIECCHLQLLVVVVVEPRLVVEEGEHRRWTLLGRDRSVHPNRFQRSECALELPPVGYWRSLDHRAVAFAFDSTRHYLQVAREVLRQRRIGHGGHSRKSRGRLHWVVARVGCVART
jgi:hypothetical protein